MKPARIFVLAIALVAGLAAALLAGASKPPQVAAVPPPPPVPTDGVLVAANDLARGDILAGNSLRWGDWPAEKIPEGVIRKSASPGAIEELKGGRLRANLAANEPIRKERVATGPHSGFMSSDLPAGMRAVAINIDTQGSSTAGGFILPDDTVDVIHIYREEHFIRMFPNEQFSHKVDGIPLASETILENIRVLAIGQNFQMKNGERVVTGASATLEVTSEQAECLLLAQRTGGTLALSLRSISDSNLASSQSHHSGNLLAARSFDGKGRTVR